jgi:phosphoribosylformimino-5-aminoimidazole carboxamide ribotide isomerase
MQVIPVLDLLDGQAVRAVRGERARYRPIESSLCATSEPLAVAHALLDATNTDTFSPTLARTLYIADLGAILGQGDHATQVAALLDTLAHHPGIEIWLDAGYTNLASMHTLFERIEAARQIRTRPRATLVPVFGTESLRDPHALRDAEAAGFAPVLSLDHRAGCLIGNHGTPVDPTVAAAVQLTPSAWPSRVIVMTLDHVGSYDGPDLTTFAAIQAQAGERLVMGAGGIRHAADLSAAAQSGAAAWLVASAIHDHRLDLHTASRR